MSTDLRPCDFVPGLTDERLQILADLIADAASEAADAHDAGAGERSASLGMSRFDRAVKKIKDAAEVYDWLDYAEEGWDFQIIVDHFPIRFYRDSGKYPVPERRKTANYRERAAKATWFEFMKTMPAVFHQTLRPGMATALHARLYYRTDPETEKAFAACFSLLDGDNEDTGRRWDVPIVAKVSTVTNIDTAAREGADLPAPVVAPPTAPSVGTAPTGDGNGD